MTTLAGASTLVPHRHSQTRNRVLALAGVLLPPCAVALAVGIDGGDLLPAIVLVALALVCAAFLVGIALSSRIELVPGGLRNHRLSHDREIRDDQVVKAVVRRIQNTDEMTSQRHLFLLDGFGRTMFRMSNRWWTDAQIARVVAHLGVPVESSEEVLHPTELRRIARRELSPRERHPALWTVANAAAVVALSVVIAGLATAAL